MKKAMLDTTKKRNMSSNVDNDYELIGRTELYEENGDCWSQEQSPGLDGAVRKESNSLLSLCK